MRGFVDLIGTAPALLWTSAIADALIGAAYYSIALALVYLAVRRADLAYRPMFFLGGALMFAGGTIHFASLLASWQPGAGVEAIFKAATAAVSAVAAILLWPIVPKALARPVARAPEPVSLKPGRAATPQQYTDATLRASEERFRKLSDDLEARIAERAAESEASRLLLQWEIEERQRAEGDLARARSQLDEAIAAQGRHAMALAQLGALAALLQACRTEAEIYSTVARFAPSLFAAASGAVYVLNATRSIAGPGVVWGQIPPGEQAYAAGDCWALRRGKLYPEDAEQADVPCPHLHAENARRHACVPLVVAGELLGVLHLRERVVPIEGPERAVIALATERIALAIAGLKLRDSMTRQLVRDPLTGLYSRRYLEEFLALEERRGLRTGRSIGIVMLDLDRFNQLNDAHGRQAGDVALRRVAAILQEQTRAGDLPCRYGGEEFLLVLPGASLEVTLQRAEQLRATLASQPLAFRGTPIGSITASIGVAAFPESGTSVAEAVAAADRALYLAKQNGRNRVECEEHRAAA